MHLKIIFLICIVSFTTSISVDSKLDFERSKRAETGDFKLLKLRKDASNLNESTKNSAEYKSKITDSRSDSSSSEEIDSVDVRTDPAAAMSNESLSNEDVFSKNETLEEDIPIVYGKIPSKIYFQEFTKQPKWFQNLPLFMWTTERVPCYLRIPILEGELKILYFLNFHTN